MNIIFEYSQELAITAGESAFINTSGAYTGRITNAIWDGSQNSNSAYLELSFESDDGLKANYINIWHANKNGDPIKSGIAKINAMMGLLKLPRLSSVPKDNHNICPELIGKPIGLVLQKVLYSKTNGDDSYKFEIVVPFGANTGKTLKEAVENLPAQRVEQIIATLQDKDDRKVQFSQTAPPPAQRQPAPQSAPQPVADIDDDIPF